MTYRPVPYIIQNIVEGYVNSVYDTGNIELPYYDIGTITELVNKWTERNEIEEFKNKLYPVIWFVIKDSVKENIDYKKKDIREADSIMLIIATDTKQEYTSQQRYNINIIPTLRPIYELLINGIKRSPLVHSYTGYKHKYMENLFLGRNGFYGHIGNIFNDYIDAIIIDDLNVFINDNC